MTPIQQPTSSASDAMPCSFSFLSVCSGIEAASVAWEPLGWKACAFAEIEKFPSAVLAHHWPETPNLGDMTKHHEWPNTLRPNLIVGGTPCQAFSLAGLRQGLADPRGNLTLTFLSILEQYRPTWVVWENVPGVLSDKTGAFGAFLGGLGELGYGFAYRILDAQYYGVAQRRRRVFVVGHLRDWRRAAAVLFECESLRGDSPPSRKAGQTITPTIRAGAPNGGAGHVARSGDSKDELIVPVTARMVAFGEYECDGTASTMKMRDYKDATDLVAHTLRGRGFDASEDGTGRGTPIVPAFAFERRMVRTSGGQPQEELNHCLRSDTNTGDGAPCVAYGIPGNWVNRKPENGGNAVEPMHDVAPCQTKTDIHAVAYGFNGDQSEKTRSMGDGPAHVSISAAVRRLTPRECERLQGFPDDHTLIPWRGKMAPDGPRYKALGNSMAVPVMRWIGERISQMNANVDAQIPAPAKPESITD
jgi:DNA (cytosine-5)-methyltransferase 1